MTETVQKMARKFNNMAQPSRDTVRSCRMPSYIISSQYVCFGSMRYEMTGVKLLIKQCWILWMTETRQILAQIKTSCLSLQGTLPDLAGYLKLINTYSTRVWVAWESKGKEWGSTLNCSKCSHMCLRIILPNNLPQVICCRKSSRDFCICNMKF